MTSPFSQLLFSQSSLLSHGQRLQSRKTGGKNNENVKHCRSVRRQCKTSGLTTVCSSLPNNSEFPCPEEEVFSISFNSPITRWFYTDWSQQSSPVKYKVQVDESLCEKRGLVTPPRVVGGLTTPPTPRQQGSRRPSRIYVHNYKCEDFMEYVVDNYKWKKSVESSYLAGDWTKIQTDVTPNMRHKLLVWMMEYSRQSEFSLETWCLAVNYLDRFLSVQLIAKDCLQLLGLTSLWLASKQVERVPPETEELIGISASTYSKTNFRHMEMIMLAKLHFRLSAPTPSFLLALLVETVEDQMDWPEDLARHLVELVMMDHQLARSEPSRIANCVFSVIKGSDLQSVREVESNCPQCEPQHTDQFCRDFLASCLTRVCHLLSV